MQCQDEYKLCGTGDIDHAYCVPEGADCPINDIYITNPGDTPKAGYNSSPLDLGMQVAYTSNSTHLPTVRLRLTEGKVCANPARYEKSDKRKLYKLLNTTNYGSCGDKIAGYGYDNDYDQIGSVSEDRLFEDNGVAPVISNLKGYPVQDSFQYNWYLYTNAYNFWSSDCEGGKPSRQSIISTIDESTHVVNYQYTLFIWAVVHVSTLNYLKLIKYSSF